MNPWEKVMEELVPDPVARKQLQQALRTQVLSSSLKSGIQEPACKLSNPEISVTTNPPQSKQEELMDQLSLAIERLSARIDKLELTHPPAIDLTAAPAIRKLYDYFQARGLPNKDACTAIDNLIGSVKTVALCLHATRSDMSRNMGDNDLPFDPDIHTKGEFNPDTPFCNDPEPLPSSPEFAALIDFFIIFRGS